MSADLENANPLLPSSDEAKADPASGGRPPGKRFDFRHPVFLSTGEWRKIRFEIEEFVEALGALLSTYLRLELSVQLARLDTENFNDFTAALPPSTHLTLFKLEPLRGVSVIEIRPGIGLAIIDRMLGGPGMPAALDRDLTEMEVALMDQVVQLALAEWCKQWKRYQELRPEIFGHENSPRFLQSSSGETVMLVVTLDTRMGECVGQIQLAIPYTAFEPILAKIAETAAPAQGPAGPAPTPFKWNRNLDTVPITLAAHWPAFKVRGQELLNLKPGEFLPIEPQGAEKIELRLGQLTKFRGCLGTRENRWAIQITEIFKV